MATDWHKIRSLNGSQEKGFAELCCQLAAGEPHPIGSTFIRKGTPDAGVECYWTVPNGDESGWQAKFFLSPPNAGLTCPPKSGPAEVIVVGSDRGVPRRGGHGQATDGGADPGGGGGGRAGPGEGAGGGRQLPPPRHHRAELLPLATAHHGRGRRRHPAGEGVGHRGGAAQTTAGRGHARQPDAPRGDEKKW